MKMIKTFEEAKENYEAWYVTDSNDWSIFADDTSIRLVEVNRKSLFKMKRLTGCTLGFYKNKRLKPDFSQKEIDTTWLKV